ncbi:MAG: hypothetical protein OHK0024_32420 [Thalassobaculales bacterium]
MFDIGWSEMAVIVMVAVVVIGPKDLPKVIRTLGLWVGKARAMAREFQASVDEMVRQSELDEVRKQVEEAAKVDVEKEFQATIDPDGSLNKMLDVKIDPTVETAPASPPPATPPPATPLPAPPTAGPNPPAAADKPVLPADKATA